jgi:integrase
VLCEHGRVRRIGTDLAFPAPSKPSIPANLDFAWQRALKAAGIEGFTWRGLRHSCASYMLEAGATMPMVGEVLGHRSAASTKRCLHLTEGAAGQIIEAADKEIFG